MTFRASRSAISLMPYNDVVEPRRVELLLKHCKCFFLPLKEGPTKNLASFTLYSVVKELSSFVAQLTGKTISSLLLAVNHLMQKIWKLLGGRATSLQATHLLAMKALRPTATRREACRLSCRSSRQLRRCRRTRLHPRQKFPWQDLGTECCGCHGHR